MLGGPGLATPGKILKYRVSEMLFPAFGLGDDILKNSEGYETSF